MSEEIRASHILVQTEEEAQNLKEMIEAGEKDLETVAAQCSLCPSGANGGDLGYFPKGVMVKSFEDAAFSLEKGKLSDPVKTSFGWHLILVTDKK